MFAMLLSACYVVLPRHIDAAKVVVSVFTKSARVVLLLHYFVSNIDRLGGFHRIARIMFTSKYKYRGIGDRIFFSSIVKKELRNNNVLLCAS